MSAGLFLSKVKYWLLYGGSAKLRDYEERCLSAWKSTLTAEALALLDEQLKRLTFCQRQADGKLLCFYDMTDKTASHWPKEIFFPCQTKERNVARLQLLAIGSGGKVTIKAEVSLCRGRFFGLEFNKPPAPLKDGMEVLKVEVLLDPMIPIDRMEQGIQLGATIDAALPLDYLNLISDREGTMANGWEIHGLMHVRKVVQLDKNYYLLAEKENNKALAVVEGDQSGELYFLDFEYDSSVRIGKSFQEACTRRDLNSKPLPSEGSALSS